MSGRILFMIFLILSGLILGAASVLGTPILAVPIILLLPGPLIVLETLRRQLRQRQIARFRHEARVQKIDFDERDRETLSR